MTNIMDLYDTFLARFAFFRGFIKVLLTMHNNIINLKEINSNLVDTVELLTERVNTLEEQIKSFEETPRDRKESENFTRTTASQIMADIHQNYLANNK